MLVAGASPFTNSELVEDNFKATKTTIDHTLLYPPASFLSQFPSPQQEQHPS
jgi:hypothetical protein